MYMIIKVSELQNGKVVEKYKMLKWRFYDRSCPLLSEL
jgi:hypothetical protein